MRKTPSETIKKANNKITEIQKNNKNASQIEQYVAKALEESTSYEAIANNVKTFYLQ